VSASIPEIYRFCCLAYQNTSILQYGQRTIASEEGVQQGDPLGPLLFCLTVQPLLLSLASDLILGFLDDFTIGGHLTSVAADVATIGSSGASLGSSLNSIKSEVISCSGDVSHPQFIGFRQLSIDNATLLGAPIFAGQALNDSLSALYREILRQLLNGYSLSLRMTLSFSSNLVWEDPNYNMSYVLHLAVAIRF